MDLDVLFQGGTVLEVSAAASPAKSLQVATLVIRCIMTLDHRVTMLTIARDIVNRAELRGQLKRSGCPSSSGNLMQLIHAVPTMHGCAMQYSK